MPVKAKKAPVKGRKRALPVPGRPRKSTRERSGAILQGVMDHLAGLSSHAAIVRYCAEKWGIQERQAENYIARARQELQELVGDGPGVQVGASLQRIREIREQAIEQGNLSALIQLERLLQRLLIPCNATLPAIPTQATPVEREPVQLNQDDIVLSVAVLIDVGAVKKETRDILRASLEKADAVERAE